MCNSKTFKHIYQQFNGENESKGSNKFPSDLPLSEFSWYKMEDGTLISPLEDGELIYTDTKDYKLPKDWNNTEFRYDHFAD